MTSNFDFFAAADFAAARSLCQKAEQKALAEPEISAFLSRKALEQMLRWLFENDGDLPEMPATTSLNELVFQPKLRELIGDHRKSGLDMIRKLGNLAAHSKSTVAARDALLAVKNLHVFARFLATFYADGQPPEIADFDEKRIPPADAAHRTAEKLAAAQAEIAQFLEKEAAEKARLEAEKAVAEAALRAEKGQLEAELERLKKELAERKTAVRARKTRNRPAVDALPPNPTEAETRHFLIDLQLLEAGWDLAAPDVLEYRLPSGDRADYVLWGDDGLPLAVVEAKKTHLEAERGRQQSAIYADQLEAKTGRRPLIFYTNGYETHFWDDLDYPPRRVFGFFSKAELAAIIRRRTARLDLLTTPTNDEIAGRRYQKKAIQAVAKRFQEQKQRAALLVMATGTGKTRTAAALVDLLSKAGWAKKTLFLADRTALLKQAKRAFSTNLPNLTAVDLTVEKDAADARIVFSTYQTMISKIDSEWLGGRRQFGPGAFDLVIFDEVHRSVYNRYRAIFEHFDALRLGLTATPRAETERDTYQLFGHKAGEPTDFYELEEAVRDGFLVPPRGLSVPVKFHREGIKYAELSEAEKAEFEDKLGDPALGAEDEIESDALHQWLFNKSTVDTVIGHLMANGIKVESGEKLGKTIIFARNHRHAEFIKTCFDAQYPHLKGSFLEVIDNRSKAPQTQIDQFSEAKKLPQIAVSVDMLDTGIDVPEVVNLVFWKPVQSRVKFWQMIGRGTRLSENLFGTGDDKTHFLIFDLCQNFEYFEFNPEGVESKAARSLSALLFEARLRLAVALQNRADDGSKTVSKTLLDGLFSQVAALDEASFLVRQVWPTVSKFQEKVRWAHLSDTELEDLRQKIAPLIVEDETDEAAKRFDLQMLVGMAESAKSGGETVSKKATERVAHIARGLSKQVRIAAVAEKMPLLTALQSAEYWQGLHYLELETVRLELRELVKFLEKERLPIIVTDFEDAISGNVSEKKLLETPVNDLENAKKRVLDAISQNQNLLVIWKLRNNVPITATELSELERLLLEAGDLGTADNLRAAFGARPLGHLVRSVLGMERAAAESIFNEFYDTPGLSVDQKRFLDAIINFLTVNGVMEPSQLFGQEFSEITGGGLHVFEGKEVGRIVELVFRARKNAEAA